jgi:hypothetical protein
MLLLWEVVAAMVVVSPATELPHSHPSPAFEGAIDCQKLPESCCLRESMRGGSPVNLCILISELDESAGMRLGFPCNPSDDMTSQSCDFPTPKACFGHLQFTC